MTTLTPKLAPSVTAKVPVPLLLITPGLGEPETPKLTLAPLRVAEPPLTDLWTVPGEENQLAAFSADDRAAFGRVNATTHYHALQIADFLHAIRENRPPLVTGEAGRAVVELFTAIYQSSRERRAVALPLTGSAS